MLKDIPLRCDDLTQEFEFEIVGISHYTPGHYTSLVYYPFVKKYFKFDDMNPESFGPVSDTLQVNPNALIMKRVKKTL